MGDQPQVDSSNNPSAITNDPVFRNLHNAFQLGWSIIELKSRIQIAALSTSITGTPQPVATTPTSRSGENQTGQTVHNVLSKVEEAKKKLLLPETQQDLTALPDSAWLTSLWRATFNRIVESHKCCFPNGSSTIGTFYNLPDPPDITQPGIYQALVQNQQLYVASKMYLPYMYLYPSNEQGYADVGIQQQKDATLTGFKLYDVTRRTINCLTLLYTNPDESLIPKIVSDCQSQLIENVKNYSQIYNSNSTQAEQPLSNLATLPFNQQINSAIQILSNNAIVFLQTWDTYARETLYVSGGDVEQADEIQLVAYESGRAMASLSWGISTTIAPLENALIRPTNTNSSISKDAKDSPESQQPSNNDQEPQQQPAIDTTKSQQQPPNADSELQQHLAKAWLKVFDDRSIASIQQQISALSTAMDDAYYRAHPDIPHPNPNDPAKRTNLALPSQTIQAVTFSLDYWKRAVQFICNGQPDINTGTPTPGETAKPVADPRTPSSIGVAQPAAILKMTQQTSSDLRLALVQQAETWQPLLLHQQSLLDFTTQYVTQRILNDFMGTFEQAINTSIQREFKKYIVAIIAGSIVVVSIIGFIVFLLVRSPNQLQSLVSASVFVVGSIVGFFGTFISRLSSFFSSDPSGAAAAQEHASSISAIPGLAGAALIEAFQSGYKQILIEFDYLNHNVSITYPLVEFFISQSLASETRPEPVILIKDAYDFLAQIAWTNQDRADEISRIARAAFGPIGAFVGAQISISQAQNNKSSAKYK